MDRQFVKYTLSAQALAQQHLCFICCADKAAVGGLGLGVQNMIFAVQPNLTFHGVPQVGLSS
eukprot:1378615-Lingulodinium_polyedra.AAC.1